MHQDENCVIITFHIFPIIKPSESVIWTGDLSQEIKRSHFDFGNPANNMSLHSIHKRSMINQWINQINQYGFLRVARDHWYIFLAFSCYTKGCFSFCVCVISTGRLFSFKLFSELKYFCCFFPHLLPLLYCHSYDRYILWIEVRLFVKANLRKYSMGCGFH